jgi:hypothetical protein
MSQMAQPRSQPPGQPRQPLGVGSILKESLVIPWRYFGTMAILGLVPLLALNVAHYLAAPGDFEPVVEDAISEDFFTFRPRAYLSFLILLQVYSLVGGLVTKLVHDIKAGRDVRIANCFSTIFAVFLPLIVCETAMTFGVLIGFVALVVPGLFLMVLWCCVAPSIIAENARYRSFARSANLTKGYRWACLGVLIAILIADIGSQSLLSSQTESLIVSSAVTDRAAFLFLKTFRDFIFVVVYGAASMLIYLRLREIKEDGAWLAEVFD